MAKLTLYFKDKPIFSGIYENGVIHIGRDDTNEIVVDSLAVAPAHAAVVMKDGSCMIKQLNEKFPLLINDLAVKEWALQNNDVINVGKHYITFSVTESVLNDQFQAQITASEKDPDLQSLNHKLDQSAKQQEANLQIMDGPHIGRILPLKKAMTRLGHEGAGVVVIARRKNGYFVSALQGHDGLAVNKEPLGENTVLLKHNDIIEVDKTPMQFFLE
jgi:hypothetical protein